MIRPEDVEHVTWPATARRAWARNLNHDDQPTHRPPQHRADVPYDVEADGWGDGLDRVAGPRVLFAAVVLLAVLAGLILAAVAFVVASAAAWWGAGCLLTAGAAGMWILWDGGQE